MIGEKHITIARYRVSISNSTLFDRALLRRLLTGKLNRVVAGQAGFLVHFGTPYNPVLRVRLQPGYEEYSLVRQLLIPTVVVVTPVHRDDAAFRKPQQLSHVHVVTVPLGDRYKLRQVPGMIQPNMQLDCSFVAAEIRPRKYRQTQIDSRSIQRIQLVLEFEIMARHMPLASLQKLAK